MKTGFRRKKQLLLASLVLLLAVSITDFSINRESPLEKFGELFLNEERTTAYGMLHRGFTATAVRELKIGRESIAEVALSARGGTIAVGPADGSVIKLAYTVTVSGRNEESAERRLEGIAVKGSEEDGRLVLEATENGQTVNSINVIIDYELLLPDGLGLVVESNAASVAIRELRGDVKADATRGMVEIVDTKGRVEAKVNSASLYMTNVAGNVSAGGRYGYVSLEGVNGDVRLDGLGSETSVSGVTGNVTGDAEQGFVHLREIAGNASMSVRSASLLLDGVRGDIDAASNGGEIRLVLPESAGYSLELAAGEGGTILAPLSLPVRRDAESGRSELTHKLGDGAHRAVIQASGASISVHAP